MMEFGSRSGSYFALALFGSLFGLLGFGVSREIRLRRPGWRLWRTTLPGLFLFAVPITLIYGTALSGFYEAELRGDQIQLHYFLPGGVDVLSIEEISRIEAEPDMNCKGRWRLELYRRTGERYQSACYNRIRVQQARERLLSLRNAR